MEDTTGLCETVIEVNQQTFFKGFLCSKSWGYMIFHAKVLPYSQEERKFNIKIDSKEVVY